MMRKYAAIIGCFCAILTLNAQDLSNLRETKAFKITGSLGTNNTFYFSNRNHIMRDPVAVNLFANLNVSLFDLDLPFSFYYTNKNTAFSHPFIHFGISPRYKALRFHFGYRSLNFSQLTYSGLTFLGGGVEFDYKALRLGCFTGSLNQANSEDITDANRRPPSFKRPAFGLKLGIGGSKNFFDLIFFTAKDDTNSIQRPSTFSLVPKENLAIGTNLRISLLKYLTITSELGASAFNDDSRAREIEFEGFKEVKKIFTPRYNSALRYAGNLRAMFSFQRFSTSLLYRQVQPDYYTLGSTYMINNFSNLGWDFNANLLKSRVIINGMIGFQSDNLTKRQLYTNQVLNYMANLTTLITKDFSVTTNYNGYRMNQKDGTIAVNDTMRLDRLMHNLTIAPSYTLLKGENSHSFNLNFNLSTTNNLNLLLEDLSDFQTTSAGLSYSCYIKGRGMNIIANYNYQQSGSSYHQLSSNTFGAGAGKKFLKEDNLNVTLNTNFSFSNINDLTTNTIINCQLNATYSYQKNHNANLTFAVNNSKNRNLQGQYNISGTELIIGLGYTYRFFPSKNNEPKK